MRPKTEALYQRMCTMIPAGVSSPVRSWPSFGETPLIAASANKDCVVDVDGNSYIDYCGSWGSLIHGHAHPTIIEAVQKRIAQGTSFGISCEPEAHLADKITQHMSSIEKIRFVSSGTEATMSAIRLARGITKRDIVVKFTGNYHGHADYLLVQAGSGLATFTSTLSSAGIPADTAKYTICLPYNDLEALRKLEQNAAIASNIAGVIIEPIAGNMGTVPATKEFLLALREMTTQIGALLIIDEVITGFRVGLGGAQKLYGVKADITCLGKIIGGGFPAAAFGGSAKYMDALSPLGSVYQAGTLSGNPVAMEAGFQSLCLLEKEGFYSELERKTRLLTDPIEEYIKKSGQNACLQRVGSMFSIFFGLRSVQSMEEAQGLDRNVFRDFFLYLFSKGVYIPPSPFETCFVSMAHDDQNLVRARDLILSFFKRT